MGSPPTQYSGSPMRALSLVQCDELERREWAAWVSVLQGLWCVVEGVHKLRSVLEMSVFN